MVGLEIHHSLQAFTTPIEAWLQAVPRRLKGG
jgi:hypothetical protein